MSIEAKECALASTKQHQMEGWVLSNALLGQSVVLRFLEGKLPCNVSVFLGRLGTAVVELAESLDGFGTGHRLR